MDVEMSLKQRAVIFDLDGTLLDSLVGIARAMNVLLERLGYPQHPQEAYRYFVGEGLEQLVIRSLPETALPRHSLEQLVRDYREIYRQTWPVSTNPYDGIPELLDELTRRHIPMAIISNKSEPFTRTMVETLLSRWQFAAVRGQRDGVPLKPDPHSALVTAQRLNVPPQDFLFVGDTKIDMQTAVAAGMTAVGVLWGFREADELLAHGAGCLIQHPRQLLDQIDGGGNFMKRGLLQ
jgi:phosphoglycolate phosphatase